MQDLNALIPSNSGWVLNSATDINLWGQNRRRGQIQWAGAWVLANANKSFLVALIS